MDFEQLQKELCPESGILHLQAITLDDADFKNLFQRVWGNAAITIVTTHVQPRSNSLTINGNATLPKIEIGGTASDAPSEVAIAELICAVTATFSIENGDTHVILDFALTNSLSEVFPALPFAYEAECYDDGEEPPADGRLDQPPVLHRETLRDIHLVFTTRDIDYELPVKLRTGLNIAAYWTPPSELTFATNRSERRVWGQIVMPPANDDTPPLLAGTKPWTSDERQPGIHLEAERMGSVTLPAGITVDPAGFQFYTPIVREWMVRHPDYAPVMAYVGSLKLSPPNSTNGKEVEGEGLLAAQTWDDFVNDACVECTFKALPLTSIGDLWGAPQLTLPKGLAALEDLQLKQALIRLVKADNKPTHELAGFGFMIGLGKLASWPIVPGKLEVAVDNIRVFVNEPLSSTPRISGRLFGSLSVLGATLIASVGLPDFHTQAYLAKPIQIDLTNAFANGGLLGDLPKLDLGTITAEEFKLNLRPTPLNYQISIVVSENMSLWKNGVDGKFSLSVDLGTEGWRFVGVAVGQGGGIPLGEMLGALASKIDSIPKAETWPEVIKTLELISFEVAVTKASTSTYSFGCTGQMQVADVRLEAGILAEFQRSVEQSQSSYTGWVGLGQRTFSLSSRSEGGSATGSAASDVVVATYDARGQDAITLGEMLENVVSLPESIGRLAFELKDAFFAIHSPRQAGEKKPYLFGIDTSILINLACLPLVGKQLTAIGFQNLGILYASRDFTTKEVQDINDALPPGIVRLPVPSAQPVGATSGVTSPALTAGMSVHATLNLGQTSTPLLFPTSANTGLPFGTGAAVPASATVTDSVTWLNIQKSVGPVHFERVGVEYRDSKLWVLLSASLNAAGLTISLDGLGLGAPLSDFEPKKITGTLRGLGLDYRNAFVEIGGSFLQMPPKKKDDAPEYGGAAVIKAKGFTIGALGSYTTVNEETSFFIYGMLDYPIGGPPFFFVTGLAAGFGYNRNVVVPPIERLGQFPLIAAAKSIADGKSNAGAQDMLPVLRNARDVIPATVGEHFLAAGITFTSFKLVESTVLLTVAFGKRFELHILGLSTLRVPAADLGESLPAIAEVELALKGSFIPDDGFLELRAQLTPTSYLLSRDCHLTGGFAFCTWFKELGAIPAGDFVLTLGGYHPAYHVPAHYPIVPRLGFRWSLQDWGLTLQGDSYFALTSSAVMAGGHLLALWQSGSISAWFKAGIDFLIAWKPYHYDAEAYIDIGVQVTFEFFGTQRLSLEVGADLHIWGPPFAGEATVHLWIISFTIHFGDTGKSKPQPILWSDFQKSFLPDRKQVCSVVVADGLVRKGDDNNKNDLGIINAKHFRLVTDSRIPSTACVVVPVDPEGVSIAPKGMDKVTRSFGIAPMGVATVTSSTHTITITRITGPAKEVVCTEIFAYTAIGKNVPAALWGSSLTPQLHGPQFVNNALSGFEITAKDPPKPGSTAKIDRQSLLVNKDAKPQTCQWEKGGKAFVAQSVDAKATIEAFNKAERDSVLASLGLDFPNLADKLTYDFLNPPQIEAA